MHKAAIAFAGISIAAVGFVGGFVVGQKLTAERLGEEFDARLAKEVRETHEYHQRNTKPYATPEEAAAALLPEETEQIKADANAALLRDTTPSSVNLQRVVAGLKYHTPTTPVGTERAVNEPDELDEEDAWSTYVVEPGEDPAYDDMIVERANKTIYIVTQEEHMENAREYRPISLTYYAGDNVLVDEEDRPIENPVKAVGHSNLQFGRWSKDDNIVYVRNELIQAEFEIAFSNGKYSREVLGLDETA